VQEPIKTFANRFLSKASLFKFVIFSTSTSVKNDIPKVPSTTLTEAPQKVLTQTSLIHDKSLD
jgi:hypothetical protein